MAKSHAQAVHEAIDLNDLIDRAVTAGQIAFGATFARDGDAGTSGYACVKAYYAPSLVPLFQQLEARGLASTSSPAGPAPSRSATTTSWSSRSSGA